MDINIFSDSESDNEVEEYYEIVLRKPYTIRNRPDHMNFWDDYEFKTRFRLSKEAANELLELVTDVIRFPTQRNNCLNPLQQLLITLRFYATGNMLIAVGDFGGIHATTVTYVIRRVTQAICQIKGNYINMPDEEEIPVIHQGFYDRAAFPRVLLVIDGTHIRIQSPGGDLAENYRNRKGWFSLNVQVACDHTLKLRNVVARWPGATHDNTIFRNSRLKQKFDEGMGNSLIIGDSGYFTSKYFMTPLDHPQLRKEILYNESLICTRNCVERCIGVWKRRFPILALGLRVVMQTVQDIIIATAVLHNIALKRNEEELEVDEEIENMINEHVPNVNNRQNDEDDTYRNELINNYFALL